MFLPRDGLGDLSETKMGPEVTEVTSSGMFQPVILIYMKFSEAEQGQNTQAQNTQAQNTQAQNTQSQNTQAQNTQN